MIDLISVSLALVENREDEILCEMLPLLCKCHELMNASVTCDRCHCHWSEPADLRTVI
jgi:hypothetical protein